MNKTKIFIRPAGSGKSRIAREIAATCQNELWVDALFSTKSKSGYDDRLKRNIEQNLKEFHDLIIIDDIMMGGSAFLDSLVCSHEFKINPLGEEARIIPRPNLILIYSEEAYLDMTLYGNPNGPIHSGRRVEIFDLGLTSYDTLHKFIDQVAFFCQWASPSPAISMKFLSANS